MDHIPWDLQNTVRAGKAGRCLQLQFPQFVIDPGLMDVTCAMAFQEAVSSSRSELGTYLMLQKASLVSVDSCSFGGLSL